MACKKNKPLNTILIVVAVAGVTVLLVRHFHIKHFRCVVPGILYTSGQPRGMDYERLIHKYHIGTIVNTRVPSEHREENWYNEEIVWVRENGVNYYELPMARKNRKSGVPDEETQKQFLDIMSKPENLPVLIHDNSGRKRVSTLAAVWLVKAEGYDLDEVVGVVAHIRDEQPTEPEMEFLRGLYNNRE